MVRIVYADESDRDGRIYFIGALVVDLDVIHRIQASYDRIGRIVADAVPGFDPAAEFHGYDIFQGEGDWEAVDAGLRAKASELAIKSIANSTAQFVLRGVDIPRLRAKYTTPFPAHELAFAQALESADECLEDLGDQAIVVADEHHTAEDGRRRFRRMTLGLDKGYNGRRITRLVDTVYFGPSKHSRLLQAADMASYFWNRILTIGVSAEAGAARPTMRKIEGHLKSFIRRTCIWP